MAVLAEMVTAAEAAALAGVSVREVNRVFEDDILPEALLGIDGGRRIAREAMPLLLFYFRTAPVLEADARRRAIASVVGAGKDGEGRGGETEALCHLKAVRRLKALGRFRRGVSVAEGVTITFGPFVAETARRAARIRRARAAVSEDPNVLGGLPTLRGTRIPVYDVAASAAAGIARERILSAYPGLTPEMLDLAALYAE